MTFDPVKLRAAIQQDTEEVLGFELQLHADVERREGRYYLRPQGVAQEFAVRGDSSASKLDGFVGRQVRARGKLVAAGPPLELELTDLAVP